MSVKIPFQIPSPFLIAATVVEIDAPAILFETIAVEFDATDIVTV